MQLFVWKWTLLDAWDHLPLPSPVPQQRIFTYRRFFQSKEASNDNCAIRFGSFAAHSFGTPIEQSKMQTNEYGLLTLQYTNIGTYFS